MSTTRAPRRLTSMLAALLASASLLAVSAGQAHAVNGPAQFCYDVFLYAGGTTDSSNTCVHGAAHYLTEVDGRSTGTAGVCVGGWTTSSVSTGWWSSNAGGPTCGGDGGYWVGHDSGGYWQYPALHNHSTFQSRFEGLFYYL